LPLIASLGSVRVTFHYTGDLAYANDLNLAWRPRIGLTKSWWDFLYLGAVFFGRTAVWVWAQTGAVSSQKHVTVERHIGRSAFS
jgi:hypothetical protein